jgi:5-formyltetrahydrofolate cyclo-ligase
MNDEARKALRKSLRESRRALSPEQQTDAALQLCKKAANLREFRSAKRIAFYLPSDGEIDLTALLDLALERGQECYLPLIHPVRKDQMLFVRFFAGDTLKANRWGILEPQLQGNNHVKPQTLDLVLVPLVGFDEQGGRLGMGKGFYDRAFAFKRGSQRRRPVLIGVAHECQKLESIEMQDWDVAMDKILSDRCSYQPQPI